MRRGVQNLSGGDFTLGGDKGGGEARKKSSSLLDGWGRLLAVVEICRWALRGLRVLVLVKLWSFWGAASPGSG